MCIGHYKAVYYNFGRERDPSAIARARLNVDAKVTRVTNSDTSSFFIPQPPPPQRPATTSPTRNTHLHEHPWPPTNHDNDNRLPTKHDNHTPRSPASTTTPVPSTSPAATSRNPHYKQTRLPKIRQPPNRHPYAKKTASGKRRPAPNERHRPPSNNEDHQQRLLNDQCPRMTA